MMQLSKAEIDERAEKFVSEVDSATLKADLVGGESLLGGGSAPSSVLPTRLIAITVKNVSANELAARLRSSDPPVIARVEDGRVLVDLRTVFPEQDEVLRQILARAVAK